MSKKEAVTETKARGEATAEQGARSGETVDIGITVDLEPADDTDTDGETGVSFSFDEADLLEAAEPADSSETERGNDGDDSDSGRRSGLEDAERTALEDAGIDPEAVLEKECSYRMLLDASLEESLADSLRRRFSLPWSLEGGSDGDLERRSSEVRGLGDAEREWIAVSDDEGWQAFEYACTRAVETEPDEQTERPCPLPTPVQAVTGVGPDDAAALAEAGITSAERLATINAFQVANVLELNVLHVRSWRHNARELLE
ncbi:hypothetical protein [Natronolimnobius baerhuensis]|uniref:Helix-hairpin-helix domain-containing protein n=1 Tax=Natronolimnobius baerhuensis TaxID=253108 RepID=A0A202ECH8_9EURY|nr:hypothetical protein [Natronolimnobius baerhuensis]OVE85898.1 hypothetical protein B2G88_03560 [Natronolimnobius baerhuensis]